MNFQNLHMGWIAVIFLCFQGTALEVKAEFRFSSQRSLSAPDLFLKHQKKQVIAMAMPLPEPGRPDVSTLNEASENLDPRLMLLLGKIETHFGIKPVVTSGCRTQKHNAEVGGAPHSFHLSCKAADISLSGVSTIELRDFVMAVPERGGVGTYCSTPIVHVDVGPRRQWYWNCLLIAKNNSPFDLPIPFSP